MAGPGAGQGQRQGLARTKDNTHGMVQCLLR